MSAVAAAAAPAPSSDLSFPLPTRSYTHPLPIAAMAPAPAPAHHAHSYSAPLRRVKKFPSSSVLESDYTTAKPPAASTAPASNTSTAPHRRSRSHSQSQFDAPRYTVPLNVQPHQQQPRPVARKAASAAQLLQVQPATIEGLLARPRSGELGDALTDLRYLVLTQGVAADADGNVSSPLETSDGHGRGVDIDVDVEDQSTLRIYIWSILLGVAPMRTADYVALVRRGASSSYSKIRNDTFRTLATDPLFRRRVSEASLIRLLNAFQWLMRDSGVEATYVQGMNVLAAPFLYAARSEVEAFALFSIFIQRECPGYVRPTMEGVHRGLKLVDQCLATVDPKLYGHLQSKFLTAELYAFPSILTLSACTPPLPEVLKLWDFLLAYGAHLNILCVVAQLLLMRDDLLAAQSPMKLLRQFPPLNSKTIIGVAVSLVKRIPRELYQELVDHAR